MKNKKLIVIAGPTAVGKTALAIRVAKALQAEIVSFDSRQCYREMCIGTAMPSPDQLSEVPHHFIAHRSIFGNYNAGMYGREALERIHLLFETYDFVVMTGGSGMYLDAVITGFDPLPVSGADVRKSLQELMDSFGIVALQQELLERDPVYYETADLQNPHRLMRALEVCRITGKPYSEQRMGRKAEHPFTIMLAGLDLPRNLLYERINQRVTQMLRDGLEAEARALFPHRDINALNTVGYKELFGYFEDNYSLEAAADMIRQNTRRYAKRQLTWFRRYEQMDWFSPEDDAGILQYIAER